MNLRPLLVAAFATVAFAAAGAHAVSPPPAADAPPAAQPPAVDPAVKALIFQLGDPDEAVRDAATAKLRAMGKSAEPALRSMAENEEDPEVRGRVRELLRQLERRPPPGPPAGGNGWGRAQSVSVSADRDGKTINVDNAGQRIKIRERRDGSIEMTVTGERDGKEATETYRAKDADELKRDNPDAHALYAKYNGGGGPGWRIGVGANGGGVRIQIGPGGAGAGVEVAPDARVGEMIRRQMRDMELPDEVVRRMQEQLDRVDRMHEQLRLIQPDLMRRPEDLLNDPLLHDRLRRLLGEEPAPKEPEAKREPAAPAPPPPELGPDVNQLGRENEALRRQLAEMRAKLEAEKANGQRPATQPAKP